MEILEKGKKLSGSVVTVALINFELLKTRNSDFMRYLVISLTCLLANIIVLKAQDTLKGGVQASFSQNSVIAQNVFEDEQAANLGAVSVEFYTLFDVNESFSVRPGLGYAQKGFQVDYGKKEFKTRLHYLQVPVTGRMQFQMGKTTIYPQVGPYFSWLIAANESGARPNPSNLEQEKDFIEVDANVTRDYKYGDIGIRGGIGIMHPVKDGQITLEINYEEGLINIENRNPGEQNLQNKGYQIAIGYLTTFQ